MGVPASWVRYDAWFLSGDCTEQGLRAGHKLAGLGQSHRRVLRILDLGIGGGVFGQRARLVYPDAYIAGVEIRGEEKAAARHYDHVFWGDMLKLDLEDGSWDLVVGNLPYNIQTEALSMTLGRLVHQNGAAQFFQRSTYGYALECEQVFLTAAPTHEFEIPGRCGLRTGLNGEGRVYTRDNSGHRWLVFKKNQNGLPLHGCSPETLRRETFRLPRLPPGSLAWTQRPGTEPTLPPPLHPIFWP